MSRLAASPPLGQNVNMGRKAMDGAKLTNIRLTPEDKANADAVMKAFRLPDRSSALRFALAELVRRDKLKVITNEEESE